jgi:hypothetical protein
VTVKRALLLFSTELLGRKRIFCGQPDHNCWSFIFSVNHDLDGESPQWLLWWFHFNTFKMLLPLSDSDSTFLHSKMSARGTDAWRISRASGNARKALKNLLTSSKGKFRIHLRACKVIWSNKHTNVSVAHLKFWCFQWCFVLFCGLFIDKLTGSSHFHQAVHVPFTWKRKHFHFFLLWERIFHSFPLSRWKMHFPSSIIAR